MAEGDLNQVLQWRNHIDVRRFMFNQHEITEEEHLNWFDKTSIDPARHLLIFEIDNTPQGFVNLYQHGSTPVADWGFYLSPNAPKGSGYQLGLCALNYAFNNLNLHKVCGEVLAFNERSIQFHFKLGFNQECILKEQHYDGEKFHNVVCFGLFGIEWNKKIKEKSL